MRNSGKGPYNKKKLKINYGICAGVVALLSLLLPFAGGGDLEKSMNFIAYNIHKGMPPVFFCTIIGCVWVIVFFALKLPKVTLVGSVFMVIMLIYEHSELSETWFKNGVALPPYHVCIGFYIFLIATFACIICAFASKKVTVPTRPEQ